LKQQADLSVGFSFEMNLSHECEIGRIREGTASAVPGKRGKTSGFNP
jgi:hypothetical protein